MHQHKNMFRETCHVGAMFRYFKITFVIHQAIKYVGRVVYPSNHFGVKRVVLVRNVRVKLYSLLQAVLQINLSRIAAMAANPKILAIRI